MLRTRTARRCPHRGVAATELALVLPLLMFLVVVGVDFARIFYYSTTLANCARNGAIWESDWYHRVESPHKTVADAALADAHDLSDPNNKPTVASATGTLSTGQAYVEVTVTYKFRLISGFPGVPDEVNLARTVRMATAPLNPTS